MIGNIPLASEDAQLTMGKIRGGWAHREPFICAGCGRVEGAFTIRAYVWEPQMTTPPPAADLVLDVLMTCEACEAPHHMRWYDRGETCLIRLEPARRRATPITSTGAPRAPPGIDVSPARGESSAQPCVRRGLKRRHHER
jgi:hypothetical protein